MAGEFKYLLVTGNAGHPATKLEPTTQPAQPAQAPLTDVRPMTPAFSGPTVAGPSLSTHLRPSPVGFPVQKLELTATIGGKLERAASRPKATLGLSARRPMGALLSSGKCQGGTVHCTCGAVMPFPFYGALSEIEFGYPDYWCYHACGCPECEGACLDVHIHPEKEPGCTACVEKCKVTKVAYIEWNGQKLTPKNCCPWPPKANANGCLECKPCCQPCYDKCGALQLWIGNKFDKSQCSGTVKDVYLECPANPKDEGPFCHECQCHKNGTLMTGLYTPADCKKLGGTVGPPPSSPPPPPSTGAGASSTKSKSGSSDAPTILKPVAGAGTPTLKDIPCPGPTPMPPPFLPKPPDELAGPPLGGPLGKQLPGMYGGPTVPEPAPPSLPPLEANWCLVCRDGYHTLSALPSALACARHCGAYKKYFVPCSWIADDCLEFEWRCFGPSYIWTDDPLDTCVDSRGRYWGVTGETRCVKKVPQKPC